MKINKYILLWVVFLWIVFLMNAIFAGTTGKIVGSIKDADSQQPLPGVNVIIEGTTLGAATDLDGNYVIVNIPPGVYNLKTTMMGYQPVVIENVRVRVDLTTTINSKLSPTILEAEEAVTIVAERPLVQMDMTYSLSSVGADEIESLPVQSVNDVLELQAGIVESDGLHIRGGRSGEIAYWVDGVSTTEVFSGGMGVHVENSAVEELQVVSGTYNAEYGQAMSGIVNIITKEGSNQYKGEIKAYIGDYFSTDELYSVWNRVDSDYDSTTGNRTINEDIEYPLKKYNPIYNGEFSLSGPVPFLGKYFTFFANGRYFSDEGYLYGREWFKPQGIPGDSSLVPMNPFLQYSTQTKLTFRPSANLKMNYNVFWNQYQRDRTYSRNYKYVPGGIALQKGGGFTHIFTLNHLLSPKTYYEIRVNRFYNEYKRYVHQNPEAHPQWLVYVPGDSVHPEMTLDLATAAGQTDFEWVKQEGLEYQFQVDPNNSDGYVHADSARDPASYSFYRAGNDLRHFYRTTAYWVGKLDFSSQIHRSHALKFGAEFRQYELTLDDYELQPKRKPGKDEQIVPFVPEIPPPSSIFHDQYTREPREFALYLQDKMEYKDINLNLGLRFDYFDPNHVVPADPTDPNIWDPFKNEHIYKNWVEPPPGLVGTELDEYYKKFEEYTAEERKAFMHKKVDAKWQLSPRLAIAYPITDKGMIHVSYGYFFQIPEFQYLYDSPDFKLTSGGGRTIVGNADLKPQRTTQYEIGLQQQVTDNMKIDITIYYRDIRDWVGTSPLIRTYRPVVSYSIYENKDYSNVRGVTLQIDKRFSNNFAYHIDYSYLVAEGTYSNPNDAFYALQNEEEPRINLIPLDWDQRQTLNAQLMYRIKGWTASLIGKYWTGRPYTPSFAKGTMVGGSAFTGLRENSARRPNISGLDCYLMKEFRLSGFNISAFVYVYNLFDQRGQRAVYSDTGTADYTTYPKVTDVPYSPTRISTVEDFLIRPEWHIAPREIQLGFTLGF